MLHVSIPHWQQFSLAFCSMNRVMHVTRGLDYRRTPYSGMIRTMFCHNVNIFGSSFHRQTLRTLRNCIICSNNMANSFASSKWKNVGTSFDKVDNFCDTNIVDLIFSIWRSNSTRYIDIRGYLINSKMKNLKSKPLKLMTTWAVGLSMIKIFLIIVP